VRALCNLVAWKLRGFVASDPQLRFFSRLVVRERLGEISEFFRQLFGSKGRKKIASQKIKREGNI
jgi:hypothetical protein